MAKDFSIPEKECLTFLIDASNLIFYKCYTRNRST
jgi:hypothetical protein